MLYRNQTYSKIQIGDTLTGFVRRITEDRRIDVALQKQGFDEVKDAVGRVTALLEEHGGVLPVGDKSAPEDVARLTGMSKKVFKRALGMLLKSGTAEVGDNETKFIRK
jgi:predicted RNA-binding protein (virulence factor B family)